MTYPWAAGDVLTAADLNTYAGLVYVSKGTFSAVTSFDVTGFDTTFTFYRLVLRGEGDAGNLSVSARLYNSATAVTTGYYSAAGYANVTGTAGHWDDRDNGAEWNAINLSNSTMTMASYDIMGDETERIAFSGLYFGGTSPMIYIGGSHDAVAFDRIRFTAAANMSGLWRLYGYNEG